MPTPSVVESCCLAVLGLSSSPESSPETSNLNKEASAPRHYLGLGDTGSSLLRVAQFFPSVRPGQIPHHPLPLRVVGWIGPSLLLAKKL